MAVRRRPVNTTKDEQVEDSTPSRSTARTGAVRRGWGSPSSSSSTSSEPKREGVKAPYLVVSKEKQIIRFVDDMPAVRFSRHYVGGRYQNCPESLGVLEGLTNSQGAPLKCPLCEGGNTPSDAYMINVVNVSDVAETNSRAWKTRTYQFGKEVHDQLVAFVEGEPEKYDPINQDKWYWHVFQVGGPNDRKSTKILPLKARDIQEDYGIEPLSEAEIDEISQTVYDEKSIFAPYVSALAKLAATLD